MPKIVYVRKQMRGESLSIVEKANEIIDAYMAQGYNLTLRQLYYQFVARDLVVNTVQSYKRLGSIVNDARLAGMIDWNAVEDRTRGIDDLSHWEDPADIMRSCAAGYRIDKWAEQPVRIEVWIEKEALAGVFSRICRAWDVPLLSCRGYTSQSEMWRAAMRMKQHIRNGQSVVVLHFGDHDPSGIDMTRDIEDRLDIFGVKMKMQRLALNMDQVAAYDPPPNPAKVTDSRFESYAARFGDESWELDALEPKVLATLVEDVVNEHIAADEWSAALRQEERERQRLQLCADHWDEVSCLVDDIEKEG